jgi:glycosyltransferase involved in cell wall biosynthesis
LSISSNQPRKRLDILIEVFAGLHGQFPELKLVRVGNEWTPKHQERIRQLGLESAIVRLHGLSRQELA